MKPMKPWEAEAEVRRLREVLIEEHDWWQCVECEEIASECDEWGLYLEVVEECVCESCRDKLYHECPKCNGWYTRIDTPESTCTMCGDTHSQVLSRMNKETNQCQTNP